MNNKEFVSQLASRTGFTMADTQKKIYLVMDAMNNSFQEGDAVGVVNFGVFEVKKKMERILVNPSSGQRMLVPPKLVLGFKPSAAWRDKVRQGAGGEDTNKSGEE